MAIYTQYFYSCSLCWPLAQKEGMDKKVMEERHLPDFKLVPGEHTHIEHSYTTNYLLLI